MSAPAFLVLLRDGVTGSEQRRLVGVEVIIIIIIIIIITTL